VRLFAFVAFACLALASGPAPDDRLTAELAGGRVDASVSHWLLDDLARALAGVRTDSVTVEPGTQDRRRIRWQGGAEAWVNRGASDWTVGGHVLPPFGFYARAGSVEAAVERKRGIVTEWARSPEASYVNVRAADNPGGKLVAFEDVVTNGALRLTRAGNALILTPLPGAPAFEVRVRSNALNVDALDASGKVLGPVPAQADDGLVVFTCEPDVSRYRLH
jgi:hypothetical protein